MRISDARDLARTDMLRATWRKELAFAEGHAKGRADALLELLGLRFGPVSEATHARIESVTLEQLDVWTERVLTAKTNDEVLAP